MANLNTDDKQNLTNNVCNELLKEGIKPTVTIVLARVPFTNTRSSVHKYFKNWIDDQIRKKEEMFKKSGFSPEFISSVLNEISRFNVNAEGRYVEQTQYANDQRDHAISDLQSSEKKVNEQASLINQQEQQINNLQTELVTEQKSNESTIVEIRRQLATSVDDYKQLSKQNELLSSDISKAEIKLESNQELVDEMKSQATRLIAENKELHSNIAELNRSIASKEATILGNDKLILTLESELEKTTKQLINFDSNNVKLQSELDSLRSELANINTKLSNEKDKLIQQVSINNELKSNFEEQTRSHDKALNNHEATIAANEKLIIQLEKTKSKA